jgi:hypothetical protein
MGPPYIAPVVCPGTFYTTDVNRLFCKAFKAAT